ncbi:hypothetical protein [Archangium sp.]|uniref:hypothetical protein n=1 Tax=Archangium sp. TaxID=1872627 RepID=UPI002D3E0334|nr:hypothetical protein [Archangium sp.]HYO51660.1 hypothetical protein [Archangium sp.]
MTPIAAEQLTRAIEERAHWGLPAERSTVASLLESGHDVGTERLGIPMTQEELDALDLPGRMAFAHAVRQSAVPFVNSLPTSGGVYIDQQQNGSLVVLLTEPSAELEAEIAKRMPASSRGFRVARATHTEAQLREALTRAWDTWKTVAPTTPLLGAGLDIMENRILFEVDPVDLEGSRRVLAALGARMGVRVGVAPRAPEESQDTSCTSRDSCYTPTRAGTRIYKGAIDSVNECTMAFHVVSTDGDIEFVTAGHCGYGGSNYWYIKDGTSDGLLLGTEQKTLYSAGGQDIMRVQLPVDQKSHLVYGESRVYGGSGACPVVGQAACASRGTSNIVDCGTVRTTWTSWVSNTANVVVWGGDMDGVASEPGDSGSPIFDRLDADHWGTVGVLNTTGGMFAVLCKAESGLAITGKAY